MIKIHFTKEQKLLHRLIIHSNDMPSIGLLNGKMGAVLLLAEYSRIRKMPSVEQCSDALMEQIMQEISNVSPLDFSSGLAGIGWGIEYLIQKKFLSGDGADICADIDNRIMQHDVRRMTDFSLEKGLQGWLHYIVAHMQGAIQSQRVVFDPIFISDISKKLSDYASMGQMDDSFLSLSAMFGKAAAGLYPGYEFSLSRFIEPRKNADNNDLSLHTGIAGNLGIMLDV